jgi:uncharacterized protein (DUF4415 family)
MSKRAPLTDADGEVRALTAEDMARFRPASQALPVDLQETLGVRRRGPQKAPTKVSTTIRLDADLLEALKATGEGWQTRVNALVRRELMGKA